MITTTETAPREATNLVSKPGRIRLDGATIERIEGKRREDDRFFLVWQGLRTAAPSNWRKDLGKVSILDLEADRTGIHLFREGENEKDVCCMLGECNPPRHKVREGMLPLAWAPIVRGMTNAN